MRSNKMKELVDLCWDATSAARNTIRVKPTKPTSETAESYYVSFILNIDFDTHRELVEEAERQRRLPQSVLRDYLRMAFKVLFQDEVDEEQKAA
jgi:hypothetical protein